MNKMIVPNQTMTSKQIAEIVQSRHDSVKRTIERLATDQLNTDGDIKSLAVIVRPPMVDEQSVDSMGRSRTESVYHINERDSYIVVAQLCPEYTAKLVDYWMATKNQAPALDLSNPEHLRNALLGYTEKVIALEHQVEVLTPKAAAHDRIADAAGLFGVREAAKILSIKQKDLVAFLLNHKWAYRDDRNTLQGYAPKVNLGYIEHIFSPPIMTSEGEKVFNTMRLTAKGVSRIGEILAQGVAA